jgi:hypothetical protein
MAASIASIGGSGPGVSASRPVFATGTGRTLYEHHFTVTFDSSYPTGGESIAAAVDTDSPWSVMTTVSRIVCIPVIAPGGTGGFTAGDVLYGIADLTNKKLLLYLNVAAGTDLVQVTDTTAAQLITMSCIAYGF